MPSVRARRLALAIAVVLAFAVPAGSAHAAAWSSLGSPTVTAGTAHGGEDGLQIAFDDDGNGLAVWRRVGVDYRSTIWASTIQIGDDHWSAPQLLSVSELNRHAYDPRIAMDPDGNALITWSRDVGQYGPSVIQWAEKPAGDPIGAAQTVPLSGGAGVGTGSDATPVVDETTGTVTLVYVYDSATNGEDSVIRTQRKPLLGGTWAEQTDLTANTVPSYYPDVDIDQDGHVTAAWRSAYQGQSQDVFAKTYTPGSGWQATADTISSTDTTNGEEVDVEVAADGKTVATWMQQDGNDFHTYVAVRPAGGSWIAPADIGANTVWPSVGSDDDANFTLVYQDDSVVTARRMPATLNAFGPATELSDDNGTVAAPRLAVAWAGETTVTWRDAVAGVGRTRAAHYEDDAWTEQQDAIVEGPEGGTFGDSRPAFDSNGNVVLGVSKSTDTGQSAMTFAVYDRTAPFLDDVVVPPMAIDGAPVELSATTTDDDWGEADVKWTFADGDEFGSPIQRSFEGAGTHPVKVYAVDDAGNASDADEYGVVVQSTAGNHTSDTGNHHTGGTGTGTGVVPAPPLPPTHPLAPIVNTVNQAAALMQQLLGPRAQPFVQMLLETVQVFVGGEIKNGQLVLPARGGSFGLFGFYAKQDTTITSTMSLTGLPGASGKKASTAATRTVKLPKQTLKLKKGQAGTIKLKISSAQRKLIKKAKGRARLVVKVTEQPAGGKPKASTVKLKLK